RRPLSARRGALPRARADGGAGGAGAGGGPPPGRQRTRAGRVQGARGQHRRGERRPGRRATGKADEDGPRYAPTPVATGRPAPAACPWAPEGVRMATNDGVIARSSAHLRDLWSQYLPAFGLWSTLADPGVAELLAATSFDYVCVDLQHGMATFADLPGMLQAMRAAGHAPVARVPWNDPAS